ncbi:MAG: flagellar biosynthesis protein FlhA [Candidatus Eisenbacteria bacterium]|uniref:Flagellar biosynthesis protein FlhA n=1 Tax=Eiseniibacteriota bacterium TaxID=2212470 RepID=A0A849SN60_UNCEI|nr:flagellar biosynthesis protein FlhA [Candidatus Eisenbacteria bacterium]
MPGGAAGVRTSPGGRAIGAPAPRTVRPGNGFSLPKIPGTAETVLAIGVVAVVALLVVPLPPLMLDILLAMSLALSLVVMLVTVATRDPLEFSVFPSLLLLLTLLRLGLNVSSTRLILSTGHAGEVIRAFGNFVIGGNVVVGLVIFLILVVINFMVITKGAGRIAEVAARFTLDAMPGRQMSIDADLSAGLIDEHEARRRREEIARYADFYGAMDGAAKFVRGDAVAGLVITIINLVGGVIIGMTQRGLAAGEAFHTYSALTIGDGLVTQIPALIVSTAAGLLVTYGSGGGSMAPSVASQLTRNVRPLWTASGILGVFALVPGLPMLPFLGLSGVLAATAFVLRSRRATEAAELAETEATAKDAATVGEEPPAMSEMLSIEPLEIEIGYGLVPLADAAQGGDLLQRIGVLRKQIAFEIGLLVPPTRIRDNVQLGHGEYVIKLRGARVGGGDLLARHLFALDLRGTAAPLDGVPAEDPSFGMRGVWIDPSQRVEAEAAGYVVVEPATVMITHLLETIRTHAAELLTRQGVRQMLDGLKETHPALIEDVVPNKLSLGAVHRVLQRLLREGVAVRDLVVILEALSDAGEQTKDPEALTEVARRALGAQIAQQLGSSRGPVRALAVGPRLEVSLMQLFTARAREGQSPLDPAQLTRALQSLTNLAQSQRSDGRLPPLVTPPALRVGIRRLVEPLLPRLPVISLAELPPQTPIETLALWELERAA